MAQDIYIADAANRPRLNKAHTEVMEQVRFVRAVIPAPAPHWCYLTKIEAVAVQRKGEAA
ncbi:hypothetical protein [Variovorax sp. Root434]|uniref:hypothetical protein n=1 Tax=Variovorax sp. Root434 TaxID=1736536 RepID=UPI0006FF64B9|nr:hypothetical protein [Variovorax sp. Root434]KQX21401.1 hypothetical protein ASD05_17735 [Variovorax sp. Root434]